MPELTDFHVDENKVWFTGGYWPEGVPKQIADVEGVYVSPLFEGYLKQADKYDYWDKDVCLFALGPYMEGITFRKVIESAKRFGTFLYDQLGVRKGDVVAIDFPNSINFVVAYVGCQYIGAVVAGVNPQYKPMELLHELKITNAKVLVLMDALWIAGPDQLLGSNNQTQVTDVIVTNLLDFVTADKKTFKKLRDNLPDFGKNVPEKTESVKIWRMLEVMKTEPREIEVDIDPWEDSAVYLMTGGTTGLPKAAMLTHANLITNLHMIRPWTALESGMITIGSIPFFHSFGMTCVMNASLALGMIMLLFPKPPKDEDLCETINKLDAPEGIIYVGVEMLFKRLTEFVESVGGAEAFKAKYDVWKKLKYCCSGAGPLHDYVREPFEEVFCPIRVGYGLTESSPVASIAPFWGEYKTGKLGLPLPGQDWAIFDPANFEAGPTCDGTKEMGHFGIDHTGEICLAGPNIMKGYLGHQEDNIRDWNGKRWLMTGDIGFMDEHGFVEIRDRKKSLIKVSGHSVFPKEVEELMGQHEMVAEVAVAGIPDEDTGEAVKAWVNLKRGFKKNKDITSDQLKQWCRENMAKWKSPKYVEFVRRLPVSLTGKVQRRQLQEKDLSKLKKGREIRG